MTRLFLFIATNLAIVFLISITFQILGIDGLLMANGVDMNLNALLVMSGNRLRRLIYFIGHLKMVC